jgi:hypothetical protein
MQTKLEGWAIPVAKEGPLVHADHTYVVSSDGKKWGCWGRNEGGRKICEGQGDSKKANCLSQPGGTALIVYAVTGVCHQTANRILRPTRKTVSQAQAYAASWALYGAYGGTNRALDPAWKAHEAICGIWEWKPDPLYLPQDSKRDHHFEALHAAYSKMAKALHDKEATGSEAVEEVRKLELEAVVRCRIEGGLPPKKLKSIASSRADMLAELEPVLMAMTGPQSVPDGAERANRLLNGFLVSVAKTLDKNEFKALFDVAPGTQLVVAEPGIASRWIGSF